MVLEGSNLRSNNLSVITTTTKQSLPDCVFQITHQKKTWHISTLSGFSCVDFST